MASIKMCDRCDNFFPEGAIGSGEITNGIVRREREDGSRYSQNLKADLCPDCIRTILEGKKTIQLTAKAVAIPDADGDAANGEVVE